MSMIFPGMDPYLEDPIIWHGVHNRFVVHVADHLQLQLPPRYLTSVEERVYVEGPTEREIIPDVWLRQGRPEGGGTALAVLEADAPVLVQVPELEIHETFIEILDRQSGQKVVSVIEVVSPTNKYAGPGRDSYQTKQREVLSSEPHLVEIDLLRAGSHVLAVPEWAARGRSTYDYLVGISRASRRGRYELYPFRLRDRLPRIRLPLANGDPDLALDLRPALERTYEMGSYTERLNYDAPCVPPLSPEDQAWANELIRQAKSAEK